MPAGLVVEEAGLLAGGQVRGGSGAGGGHPPQQGHQLAPVAHPQRPAPPRPPCPQSGTKPRGKCLARDTFTEVLPILPVCYSRANFCNPGVFIFGRFSNEGKRCATFGYIDRSDKACHFLLRRTERVCVSSPSVITSIEGLKLRLEALIVSDGPGPPLRTLQHICIAEAPHEDNACVPRSTF